MVTKTVTNKSIKSPKIFSCNFCHYECSNKHDYEKHLTTRKHLGNTLGNIKIVNMNFTCKICNKIYKSRVGIWRHKRKCVSINKIDADIDAEINVDVTSTFFENNMNIEFKTLVLEIVKSNTELQKQTHDLQKQMLEVCKNNTIIHNSTNNSHNKTFNLQVFLNEECKDAMNLTDFMNSFQLQLEDLEKVGTMGYVDGVSNIILKKLREMDVNKRPMHCSDAKREIMYIKEEDKWEKEGLNNLKLKKAITIIENKNIKLLGAWKEAHPKYMEYDEPDNDIYTHLIIQTMSNCDDFGNKVIKKLAKEVTIDK